MSRPNSGGGARRRLVVAIEGDDDGATLIDAAVRLAARLERDVVALFLEDTELLAAAGLPVARVVGRLGGETSTLDAAALRRVGHAQAQRARQRLEVAAVHFRVRWQFAVAAGGLAGIALASTDLLATGPRPRAWLRRPHDGAPPPPCPTLLIGRPPGPVVMLYEGGVESLMLALRLAREEGVALVVLALPSGLATADDRDREARRHLAAAGAVGPHVVLAAASEPAAALVALIKTWQPSLVVADTCRSDQPLRIAARALRG